MSREGGSELVVTAVGPDRPGLVRAISALVYASRASVDDSRMAILGGEFALILLVSGAEPAIVAVERGLAALEADLGLKLLSKRTRREPPKRFLPYAIRVTGLDRPGIVHAVAELLERRSINVASLDSRVTFAALSGTALFVLEAELQIPSELALDELREEISALCREENLDYALDSKT